MAFKSLCNEEQKSQAPCGLELTDGAQVSSCWAPGSSPPAISPLTVTPAVAW